ncbi:MAG: hypothetical protein AB1540_14030 [Bdellovibrionota bacterium]
MKIEGLSTLLETLKEEIERWELEPGHLSPEDIHYGLYLVSMDILYAETIRPGGYESYSLLPDRVLLSYADYEPIRAQLAPFITWLHSLMLKSGLTAPEVGEEILLMSRQSDLDSKTPLEP